MSVYVKTELFCYPVLEFSKGMVFPARTVQELEQCSKTALHNGFFSNLRLIDSNGKSLKIIGARKLRGVGLFFGFNILLNQRIQVALTASGPEQFIGVEEVRRLVLGAIRGSQGWKSTGNVDELVSTVSRATSVQEIAATVTAAYYRESGFGT